MFLRKTADTWRLSADPDPHVPACVYAEAAKQTFLKNSPHRKVFSFTIEGT
jgi:hypothetical protein